MEPQIKVLALIDHLALGGAQMLLGQFAAAAPQAGIAMSVACLRAGDGNPAAAPLRSVGVEPVTLDPAGGRPGSGLVLAVRRHIASLRPHIVHTHLGTADWIGGLTARSLRIPMVCTLHLGVWDRDFELYAKRMLVRACAARVIAVSAGAERVYRERHWARRGQLVIVHNGVDVEPQPGAGKRLRSELGWAEDDLVLGMVSSLRPEKAHDVAIAAIRLLRERFPRIRLLIVGEGPSEPQIQRAASDLGSRVRMIGLRLDVMRCLDACDICLHPSRTEAFPTTLIEAMAASVPVVATNVGGIPEIIEDGRTGVLVAPPPAAGRVADAVGALLEDPGRRRELASAARAEYERRLTASRWAQEMRGVYDDVLTKANG